MNVQSQGKCYYWFQDVVFEEGFTSLISRVTDEWNILLCFPMAAQIL